MKECTIKEAGSVLENNINELHHLKHEEQPPKLKQGGQTPQLMSKPKNITQA